MLEEILEKECAGIKEKTKGAIRSQFKEVDGFSLLCNRPYIQGFFLDYSAVNWQLDFALSLVQWPLIAFGIIDAVQSFVTGGSLLNVLPGVDYTVTESFFKDVGITCVGALMIPVRNLIKYGTTDPVDIGKIMVLTALHKKRQRDGR